MTSMTGKANLAEEMRTIEDALVESREIILQRLTRAPAVIRPVTTHLSTALGKGIRARLLITCAGDANMRVPAAAAEAAAAVELLHLATLVHDDVIDCAPTRRGIASVQAKFGSKQAVICGDYLLCEAMDILCGCEEAGEGEQRRQCAPQLFARYARSLRSVCLGELEQHRFCADADISVLQYFRVIYKKTAALFMLSAAGGAFLARCDPPADGLYSQQERLLLRFAAQLGTLFQIADDLGDYNMSATAAGKPVRSDICSGVITLPLILAMRSEPAVRTLALEALKAERTADELARAVQEAQGTRMAEDVRTRIAAKATRSLARLENRAQADALHAILISQS